MKNTILFFFILISFLAVGQSYHITPIKVEDGLSQNEVYAMIQDRRGSIWFATRGGAIRYSGDSFKLLSKKQGYPTIM